MLSCERPPLFASQSWHPHPGHGCQAQWPGFFLSAVLWRGWPVARSPATQGTLHGTLAASCGYPTRGLPRAPVSALDLRRYLFLLFAAFFSSTTACAAASRAIGTRNGDALT